jgi:hypothetical protein
VVVLSTRDGSFHLVDGDSARTGPEEVVLPWRFGPLNQALETIEAKQGWLLSHEPVLKTERGGNARIDFINMGGFVFDPACLAREASFYATTRLTRELRDTYLQSL